MEISELSLVGIDFRAAGRAVRMPTPGPEELEWRVFGKTMFYRAVEGTFRIFHRFAGTMLDALIRPTGLIAFATRAFLATVKFACALHSTRVRGLTRARKESSASTTPTTTTLLNACAQKITNMKTTSVSRSSEISSINFWTLTSLYGNRKEKCP